MEVTTRHKGLIFHLKEKKLKSESFQIFWNFLLRCNFTRLCSLNTAPGALITPRTVDPEHRILTSLAQESRTSRSVSFQNPNWLILRRGHRKNWGNLTSSFINQHISEHRAKCNVCPKLFPKHLLSQQSKSPSPQMNVLIITAFTLETMMICGGGDQDSDTVRIDFHGDKGLCIASPENNSVVVRWNSVILFEQMNCRGCIISDFSYLYF